MKKIIIICAFLTMVGCGRWVTVSTIPTQNIERTAKLIEVGPPTPINSKTVYVKNYKIGEIKTASIGQEIIRIDPYKIITQSTKMKKKSILNYFNKTVSYSEPLSIKYKYKLFNYEIGSRPLRDHLSTTSIKIEGQTYNIFLLPGSDYNRWGVLINDKGEIFKSGLYNDYNTMMFYPETINITPIIFNISKVKIKEADAEADADAEPKVGTKEEKEAPYELIYAGQNNVSLNVTYREYTPDDIARTAFYQNITYQADAKNIRFRNFEIKIHSASNEKITYTVLEDGLK